MNKKMSKALAVALSAAMAASAFAIGTGSAFAAPTTPTAQATLDATKSVPQYLWNDNDTTTTNENQVDAIEVQLNRAYTNLGLLNGATLKLEDGSEIKVGDDGVTANLTNATFTTDDDNLVTLKNGEISAIPGATGTATITVSGATVTKDTTTYDVDDFTVDVDVIAPNDYSEGVWSNSASKPTSFTNEVSIGTPIYLYEAKASAVQTTTAFAEFNYTKLTASSKPAAGKLDQKSVDDFEIATYSSNGTFTPKQAGTDSVAYYPSNENATLTPKDSQELTVKGEYSGVTAITKQSDGTYNVTATGGPTNGAYTGLTAEDLAAGTFTLASSVTSIVNSDAGTASRTTIAVDTKLGTVKPQAALSVYGVEIDKVSTDNTYNVSAFSAVDAETNENIPTTIGTIETAGTVTVGDTATANNYDTIAISTIKADNVTVNTNKAEINAITKKNTAGTVTTSGTEKGIQLPALKGYALAINTDTTVASVEEAGASTIASTATLTVSGTAEFTGKVTGGTIAIAPNSLTIVGSASRNSKDSFTLALTEVTAGETAFKTSTKVTKGAYTNNGNDTTGGALSGIKTPGYTAVADGKGNAIIDKTIVAGGVKDATPGAVYDEKTGVYKLEINDDEPTTLALQPIYADSLSKDQTVTWTLKKTVSDNITLNNQTATDKDLIIYDGLTATVVGDYQKNYPSKNTFTVTATMGSTTVTYEITIVNEKTQPTTDFSLSLGANYVQPGETMEVYATPNGNQKLSNVTFSSSDPSIAMVQTTAEVNNVWSAKVAGIKDGTATITAVGTLPSGEKVTKTIDVTVTSTPVLAYVDGKLVGPTDMIDVAQSTSKDVTFFSANGTTINSFNYVTGNGKVIGTNTLNVWNGTSGAYQVYAAGKVGEATGIYVNGQKVFMAKVTERPFTSDTTMNVNLPVGKTYSFKISLEDKSAPFTFTTANGTALSTSYNKAYYPDANGDYICTIKAEKAVGGVGVYVNIAGVNYKVFTAVTQ